MIFHTITTPTSPRDWHVILDDEPTTLCRRKPRPTWTPGDDFSTFPPPTLSVCKGCRNAIDARMARERRRVRQAQTRAGWAYETGQERAKLVALQQRDADGVPLRWKDARVEYLAGRAAAEAHHLNTSAGLKCPVSRRSPSEYLRRAAWYAGVDDVLTLRRQAAREATRAR